MSAAAGAAGPSPAPSPGPAPAPGPTAYPYNWIYKQLVTNPDDAVGAIAYVLYKGEKIAFIEATEATHHRAPTPDEMRVFHAQSCALAKLDAYRAQAKQLGEAFLNAGLATKLKQYEDDVHDGVINQNVSAVLAELKARKGFVAWMGDMVASLGVNIATIIVIGALLGGYQALARFNSALEKISNVPAAAETANPAIPSNPAANTIAPAGG